jgi:hypothetical protein
MLGAGDDGGGPNGACAFILGAGGDGGGPNGA